MAKIVLRKKILISGVGGRIGSVLARYLKDNGFEIIGWYHRSPPPIHGIELVSGEVEEISGEVLQAVKKAEIIIHLAAETGLNSPSCYKVNVEGTKNLLKAIGNQKKLLIYTSTIEAFGTTSRKKAEVEDRACPVSDYGKSKLTAEKEIVDFSKENKNFNYVILRLPSIVSRKEDFVLNNSVLNGITGDYELNILEIEKLQSAILKIIKNNDFRNKIRFLPGKSLTVKSMAKKIRNIGTIGKWLGVWGLRLTKRGGVYYYAVSGNTKYRRYSDKIFSEL